MENQLKQAQELALQGKAREAAAIYQGLLDEGGEALGLLLHNLVACLIKSGQNEAGLRAAQAATFFSPDLARSWLTLAYIEAKLGLKAAALASTYRALALEPSNQSIQETRLWNLSQALDPLDYRKEAEAWYASLPPVARAYRHSSTAHTPLGRRTRVGYVSGDFRLHVMDRFIKALLLNHNYADFEVFCFDNSPRECRESEVRNQLISIPGPKWVEIEGVSDDLAAAKVEKLGIDILVDLSGLSAHNRLGLFRRHPASVQLTGVGFLPTTGASCFSYRLADYEYPDQYTEALWKLPRAAVPVPLCSDLPVTSLPAERNGFVTFGYVNGLHKLTPDSIRSFVEVLSALPTSRLVLMLPGASDGATAASILRRFDPVQDRIVLTESNGGAAFVSIFRDIDIALDPAPYGGCTTTIDTLFHGVPIATSLPDRRLAADAFFLQRELGLNPSGTLLLDAERWASDLDALALVRRTLRDRYLAHPVGDPRGWTRSLEEAYAQMVQQSGLEQASFAAAA